MSVTETANTRSQGIVQNLAIMRWLLGCVRPYWARFVLMLVLTFVTATTRISGLVLIKPFGDIILGTFDAAAYTRVPGLRTGIGRQFVEHFAERLSQSPTAAITLLVQLLFGLIVVQTFAKFGAAYLQFNLGGRVTLDLQRTLMSRLLAQP